jgi:hypothetical protein
MRKDGSIKRKMPAVMLFLFFLWSSPPGRGGQTKPTEVDLESILKKTADYCRKLEASILDFICREDVEEEVDPSRELLISTEAQCDLRQIGIPANTSYHIRKYENQYVYDYQCTRSNRILHEKRILMELNGKKYHDPNAPLPTTRIAYRNPFLSPVNLFAENFQTGYDFRVVGMDTLKKQKVVVIEVKLKTSVEGPEPPCRFGKAWIVPETADILKIEWTQRPVEGAEVFSRRENLIKGTLRLTSRAEFKTEKNGFRFPSTLAIEEAYLDAYGRAFVRSKTKVVYKDFQFFTVEVDIRGR